MILVLSPSSVKSSNVRNEITFALDEKKTIIPILHRDCEIPLQLRRIQYIDLRTNYPVGLKRVLTNLSAPQTEHDTPTSANPSIESHSGLPQADGKERLKTHKDSGNSTREARGTGLRRAIKPADEGAGPVAASAPPPSAKNYAVVALLGFIFGAGFTLFYVDRVPQLVESGVQGQIFYLLLIPWALSAAAFLFGAMKSFARFTHKHLGNFLELGGPVVLFCIVLLGGFKLVPPAPETFDLAVRAHSNDSPLITSGQVTLDLPGLPHANIGPDGEANFKDLPARVKGKSIRVLPRVDGYEESWLSPKLEGNVLDVELKKARPTLIVAGTIIPIPKANTIRILVDGQDGEASPDDLGQFKLIVNGKAGDRVRMKVYRGSKLVYDDYQVLPGPVTLTVAK